MLKQINYSTVNLNNDNIILPNGSLVINGANQLRLHDGTTAGGNPITGGSTFTGTSQLINGQYSVSLGSDGVLALSTSSTIVGSSPDPNVYIETFSGGTTSTWTFGTDGILILPANTPEIKGSGTGTAVTIIAANTVTTSTWIFDATGSLIFPNGGQIDNFFNETVVYNPNGVYISSQMGGGAVGANADSTVRISTLNNNNWIFGNDGRLTLPSAGELAHPSYISGPYSIVDGNTYPGYSELYIAVANNPTLGDYFGVGDILADGSNTTTNYVNIISTLTNDGTNWTVQFNQSWPSGNPSTLTFISNGETWTFGKHGTLTLPGAITFPDNTVQTTAWLGTVTQLTNNGNNLQLDSAGNMTISNGSGSIGALHFDGANNIVLSPGIQLGGSSGTSAFTVEFLFRIRSGYTDSYGLLGPDSTNVGSFAARGGSNGVNVTYDAGQGSTDFTYAQGAITSEVWHHIAFVRDSSNHCQVFLDGVACTSGVKTISDSLTGYSNEIGGWNDANYNNEYLNGYIAGVKIEVGNNLYDPNAGTITVPSLPFTTSTGTVLLINATDNTAAFTDASGNNTITGSATFATVSPVLWGLYNNGELKFPDNTVQTSAYTGTNKLINGSYNITLGSNGTISLPGNVTINSNVETNAGTPIGSLAGAPATIWTASTSSVIGAQIVCRSNVNYGQYVEMLTANIVRDVNNNVNVLVTGQVGSTSTGYGPTTITAVINSGTLYAVAQPNGSNDADFIVSVTEFY